ncbi:MAG TPA: AraC family transcriptional regulator [Gemmatimonadaceae bacterium]|nr:AraC family transcriptional regulator [Gemmatimonadaceae bacterium]
MPVTLPRGTYYGRPIATREVAGLILTEKRHPAGQRLPPHAHDQPYLCFVLAGSWKERFSGGERTCLPRSVIYHPPGEIHSDTFDQSARLFAMELDPSWQRRVAATTSMFNEPHAFHSRQVSVTALRLYEEARRDDAVSPLVIEGLMLELLGACSRSQLTRRPAPQHWLLGAEDILRQEFRQPPSLGALAARAGVHPVHMARAFRAHFGSTMRDFVRALRLDYASRALASTMRPVAEIALDAGFADQSHLTKAFQRHLGTTPARYRAAARLT